MEKLSIGLLELGHRENTNSLKANEQILTYAIKADELGFSRFWLAEHHAPNPLTSYTNPEILISIIAGMTDSIRVGSAGTLVKMYDAYHTATHFKLINNLFSDRIDLGLSKGNPGTQYTRDQLFDIKDRALFSKKISELHTLFHNEKENFEKQEIVIPPFNGSIPEQWYLSNSYRNFNEAIDYKLNYCRSTVHGYGLIDKDYNKEELHQYKSLFFERNGYYPKVCLAVGVSIDTTIEKARKKYYDALESENVNTKEAWSVIPVTISSLQETLYQYQELYGIDEFILLDMDNNNDNRIENIEAISDVFHLQKELIYEN
jgi:alkanesulfonate monooxygenase SsuD/methylene tetrahydromethanopterin reductase-like flavin-dependent oxidoreductase (luciferase family)